MINDLAKKYFLGQNPIGKHLIHGRLDGNDPSDEIVGIVKDSKFKNLTSEARPVFYCPLSQNYERNLTLVVRTANDPASAAGAVRQVIQGLDPKLPLYGVKTLDDIKSDSLYTSRFATLLTVFVPIGAVAGCHWNVRSNGGRGYRRTREIGIRMALGAQSGAVFRVVITEGMTLVVIGLILGVSVALACGKLIAAFLYGVSPTDPTTFVIIGSVMAAAALLANYLPARAAVKIDPMEALRYE